MKVYIAGPMRGYPNWNHEAFDAAEARWRAAGHIAFSPAATDRALGYGSIGGDVGLAQLRHVMMIDIIAIFNADAIALLPGWERSRGVAVEVALARFLNLKIFDAITGQEVLISANQKTPDLSDAGVGMAP